MLIDNIYTMGARWHYRTDLKKLLQAKLGPILLVLGNTFEKKSETNVFTCLLVGDYQKINC
jgi:hypothetical protein